MKHLVIILAFIFCPISLQDTNATNNILNLVDSIDVTTQLTEQTFDSIEVEEDATPFLPSAPVSIVKDSLVVKAEQLYRGTELKLIIQELDAWFSDSVKAKVLMGYLREGPQKPDFDESNEKLLEKICACRGKLKWEEVGATIGPTFVEWIITKKFPWLSLSPIWRAFYEQFKKYLMKHPPECASQYLTLDYDSCDCVIDSSPQLRLLLDQCRLEFLSE